MQLIGLALLAFVVWFGFGEREQTVISAFDLHALVMVLGGSTAAILVSSNAITSFRTLACLREIIPAAGTLGPGTTALERERAQIVDLWREGRRSQAAQLAENSRHPSVRRMVDLVLSRAPEEGVQATFLELRHDEMTRWQPAISNWELLAKLGPSFGMVGTITGMIQLFRTLDEDTQMGAALSLALLATLYGVSFGAGVAGPIGHFLRGQLDERIAALERCEKSVGELIARGGRTGSEG